MSEIEKLVEGEHLLRTVFERMLDIIEELPAIGKTQRNQEQGFMFRGYDQVMDALNPLLAKHGVFIVPNVVERVAGTRTTSRGSTMYEVNLHVEFTFYGADGDSFTASGWGEGTDMGDKATNKAMTGAFKYVLFQAFAISTAEASDADASSPEETTRSPETAKPAAERTNAQASAAMALIEGAVQVRTQEDADSIRQAQRDLAPDEDWPSIEETLSEWVYNKRREKLSKPENRDFWTRLANAVARAWDEGDFPPPSQQKVQDAYAEFFDGIFLELESLETPFESTEEALDQQAADAAEKGADGEREEE